MSGGDLIKWGVIGLAGWWVYETFFATTTAAAAPVTPAPVAPSVPVAPSTPAPIAPSAAVAKSLDALYQAMLVIAKGSHDPAITSDSSGTLSATGYVWNYYLTIANPSLKGAATNAADGNTVYTSAQYWALVGPGVANQVGINMGLSGVRLGLAGLGAVVMRGRR
jgi:hypothetical protein